MTKLTIIRGLPGSGKSTLAKAICADTGARHLEADMFFVNAGVYKYDKSLISAAHEWCKKCTELELFMGKDVVASNTFTQRWEFEPYLDLAKKFSARVEVITATGSWPNVHGVPQEAINRMRDRWEE